MTVPPTIIVRHPAENPKKCSVLPLKGHPALRFVVFPPMRPLDLTGYVRLAAEGPKLSSADAEMGLLLLDASWNRAGKMARAFADVPPRSLVGIRTAYPRASKRGTDPDNGLASVEALVAAHRLLGRPTTGFLDHYHWADEFLRLNGWLDLGCGTTSTLPLLDT
jgi:pre-rRNA-processing protein TSR3